MYFTVEIGCSGKKIIKGVQIQSQERTIIHNENLRTILQSKICLKSENFAAPGIEKNTKKNKFRNGNLVFHIS